MLLDIPSLRLRKKDNCLIIISSVFHFLFLFAKHIGVGFGRKGKLYMNNEIWFCGSGFSKGFSRAFPFIFGVAPFSVLLQIFMGIFGGVGTADRRYPGNFIWRMCVV